MNHAQLAQATFESHIKNNPYPGRGLVVGRGSEGDFLLVYWIMGRSPNSRNRRFVADGATLRTEPVDASKVEDPSLIIYEAMLELAQVQLVSNGDQTRTVYERIAAGGTFHEALCTREREPDAPNYTPRITAMLDFRGAQPEMWLSILKASRVEAANTDRIFYRPAPPALGLGFGLTTYMGDGAPLPSFMGDPLLLPLSGSAKQVLDQYFEGLDSDNGIAVAVKQIDAAGACTQLLVRNRYS